MNNISLIRKHGKSIVIAFYFLFLNVFFLQAQSPKMKEGRVFIQDSFLPLKGINIINLDRKISTETDGSGNYRIVMAPSDSIEFRHDKWEIRRMLGQEVPDTIFLRNRSILLEDVYVVSKGKESRSLEDLREEHNRTKGVYYGGKPPAALLLPFGGNPITFFYELFSKQGKRSRRMARNIQREKEYETVEAVFNEGLVRTLVDVPMEDMEAFMNYFRPQADQVKGWTVYDSQVYIKKSFETYKTLPSDTLEAYKYRLFEE